MNLKDLKKICAAATPGPWFYQSPDNPECSDIQGRAKDGEIEDIIRRDSGVYPPEKRDARFILAASVYMPLLIAVAEAAISAAAGWDFDHGGVVLNDIRDELNVLQAKIAALNAENPVSL